MTPRVTDTIRWQVLVLNNNLSLEKRAALSTPLHYTLLPHHIPPRPHTALSENNVGRDWEGGKEGRWQVLVLDRYTAKLMKLIADVQHTLRIGNRNEKI